MICPKKLGRFSLSIGLGKDVGSNTFTLGGNLVTCLISDMYSMSVDISEDFSGSAKDVKVIKVIDMKCLF